MPSPSDILRENGIRVAVNAEEFLTLLTPEQVQALLALHKPLLTREDMESVRQHRLPELPVEVRTASTFNPAAKEYEPDIEIHHTRDVTGKARIKGETQDFILHFRDRYQKLARILAPLRSAHTLVDIGDLARYINEKIRIIGMVYEKRTTQKGNLLLEVEDLTGRTRVIISNNRRNEKLWDSAQNIILDDVISIGGKMLEHFLIAEEVDWPEIPVARKRKLAERDLAAVYISDTHFGSRYFLHRYLEHFITWLHGKGEEKELAGKVKYLLVAGDVVDGVGVYPNHIRELAVPDVYKQYAMFDDFVEKLPDYIEVVIVPGNHDAVRRAEPMPAIDKDFVRSDVTRLGNPASISVEGIKHVLYHGTSMDSIIAHVPHATYTHPEKAMVEYLRRRHLSPIYGGNLIVPQRTDYLVLEEEPDILHCGHVHKNGAAIYRNTLLVNSGTFQDRTEFQVKQGHVPTPGMVPIHELKYNRLRTLDFREG